MRRYFKILIPTLFAGVLALTGCGSNATPQPTPTKTSIQLGWIYDYATSEFYAATKNGRFAAQNLDVDLQQGGFINGKYVDAVQEVLNGDSDFGLTSDLSILQQRANGKKVVAIAALTQRSPVVIISLAKSNIRRPSDLIGHSVSVAEGGSRMLFNAMMGVQQIDTTKINIVPRTDYGVDPLLNGKVDALVGWIMNEGVQVKAAGQEPNFMLMSDYGIESYNTVLFTTEDIIKNKPDVVEKFLRATLQGITDVVSNPDQAIDYTLAYGKDLTRDSQKAGLQAMLPLINPSGSKPGLMDPATWKASYQMAIDQKQLTTPQDITAAYTLDFLNKIYK